MVHMSDGLRLLVDCNVWIDAYAATRPRHDESLGFVNRALESGAALMYGASKLETVFYVLSAEVKRVTRMQLGAVSERDALCAQEFAWGCVNNLCGIATAVGVDQGDLWLARRYRVYHADLEDNVLLAAAQRSEADYVVTWDKGLLRDATAVVRAVTPRTMLAVLDQRL